MRWPWSRRDDEVASSSAPAPAPLARRDWATLPAIQPAVPVIQRAADVDRFTSTSFASWKSPAVHAPLAHAITPDAPIGLVSGLTSTVAPVTHRPVAQREAAGPVTHQLRTFPTPLPGPRLVASEPAPAERAGAASSSEAPSETTAAIVDPPPVASETEQPAHEAPTLGSADTLLPSPPPEPAVTMAPVTDMSSPAPAASAVPVQRTVSPRSTETRRTEPRQAGPSASSSEIAATAAEATMPAPQEPTAEQATETTNAPLVGAAETLPITRLADDSKAAPAPEFPHPSPVQRSARTPPLPTPVSPPATTVARKLGLGAPIPAAPQRNEPEEPAPTTHTPVAPTLGTAPAPLGPPPATPQAAGPHVQRQAARPPATPQAAAPSVQRLAALAPPTPAFSTTTTPAQEHEQQSRATTHVSDLPALQEQADTSATLPPPSAVPLPLAAPLLGDAPIVSTVAPVASSVEAPTPGTALVAPPPAAAPGPPRSIQRTSIFGPSPTPNPQTRRTEGQIPPLNASRIGESGGSVARLADPSAIAVDAGIAQRQADGSIVFGAAMQADLMSGATVTVGEPAAAAAPTRQPSTAIQRAFDHDEAQPPAPAAVQLAEAAVPAPGPSGGPDAGNLDELAKQLYGRIRTQLVAELRVDRERAGLGVGLER